MIKKKMLAIIISAMMIVSLLPMNAGTVYASEEQQLSGEESTEKAEKVPDESEEVPDESEKAPDESEESPDDPVEPQQDDPEQTEGILEEQDLPGNVYNVWFGGKTWNVIDYRRVANDETGKTGILLISEKVVELRQWRGDSFEGMANLDPRKRWDNSDLRSYLRNEFENVLTMTETEKKAVYKAVYELAGKGVVKGYGSYFDVNGQCTRAQFVLFLWRLAGKPAPKSTDLKFSDAADIKKLAADYTNAIAWGNEKGIVMGYTSGANKGKFKPNDPCTRGQVVLFLWRYAGKPAVSGTLTFKDADEIGKMAADYSKAILWANAKKITTGYSDNTFRPNRNCTRGECVTFLYRL